MNRTVIVLLTLLLVLGARISHAHGDEDHGDAPHPVAVTSVAPRFEARSELFELVGVLHGEELVLYLDHAASNQPIANAVIEIESGAFKGKAVAAANGEFRLPAASLSQPGTHALTLTVETESDIDLLAAQFEVASAPSVLVPEQATQSALSPLLYGLIAVIGLLVVALLWRGKRSAA